MVIPLLLAFVNSSLVVIAEVVLSTVVGINSSNSSDGGGFSSSSIGNGGSRSGNGGSSRSGRSNVHRCFPNVEVNESTHLYSICYTKMTFGRNFVQNGSPFFRNTLLTSLTFLPYFPYFLSYFPGAIPTFYIFRSTPGEEMKAVFHHLHGTLEHIGLVVRMSILDTKGWRLEPQH